MQRTTTKHPKTRHTTAQRGLRRHSAAQHGITRRDTARHSTAHRNTARARTAKHTATQHGAPQRTTTPKQGTLAEGLTQPTRRTPWKAPHQPGTHQQGATAHLATTVGVHPHKPPLKSYFSLRGGGETQETPAFLIQGLRKPPGATAQPAEPEPKPASSATRPSVYKTHPTHGAGARPNRTQARAATRPTTLNVDQCVHQPREGRGRNRPTPPKKKKTGGGGTRKAHSHENVHPQEAAKPLSQTALKTGPPEGTLEDHPVKTGDTQPRAAPQRKKFLGLPEHADTHLARAGTERKKKPRRRSPNKRGRGE